MSRSTPTATGSAARSTRTRRTRTASSAPELLVRHYEWAGLRRPGDHRPLGAGRPRPSTKKLLVIPSTELNAVAGDARRRARARTRGRGRPGRSAGEFAPLAGGRRLDRGERRRPVPRPHLLERPAHRAVVGLRRACSGSRSGTRAASSSSAAATRRSTGTRRSSAAAVQRARDRRLAPPRLRQRLRLDVGARGRATQAAVLDALRAGAFYGSTGPEIHAVEVSDDEVVVRCSPAASVTLYSGRRRGARANAGRLGYPNARRCSSATRRADHGRRARSGPARGAVRPGRGAAARRDEGLDEPAVDRVAAIEQLAARAVRPARDRRRHHRRRGSPRPRRRTGSTWRSSTAATSPARRRARRRS